MADVQSRGDQVQSYQFFLQRVVSGLVARESDPAELPFRRLGWSALGSVMITVLVLAGFGIYGVVVGGGATSWRDGGSIIEEKDSGARYVFRDGILHPVANLASARLVLGGNVRTDRVAARSLRDVPRGPTIGIPGAPDSLPGGEQLLTGGWTLCSELVDDGRGGREVRSTLGVGRGPVGAVTQTGGEPPAVLVRDPDEGTDGTGGLQLIWNRHRFALVEPEPVLHALGAGAERALPVAPAWLNVLPLGDDIGVPGVAEPGGESTALGGQQHDPPVRQGQVVEAAGTAYLVREENLLPLTPLQRDIVLNALTTVEAYPDQQPHAREVSLATAQVAAAPARTGTSPPDRQPELAALRAEDLRDAAICAEFAPGEPIPSVQPGGRLPAEDALDTPRRTEQGGLLADRVLVAGGHAALVRGLASPTAPGGLLHLVTDQGISYPLADPAVAGMLGYSPDQAISVPGALLDRVPAGPTLDPATAVLPVAWQPGAGDAG